MKTYLTLTDGKKVLNGIKNYLKWVCKGYANPAQITSQVSTEKMQVQVSTEK